MRPQARKAALYSHSERRNRSAKRHSRKCAESVPRCSESANSSTRIPNRSCAPVHISAHSANRQACHKISCSDHRHSPAQSNRSACGCRPTSPASAGFRHRTRVPPARQTKTPHTGQNIRRQSVWAYTPRSAVKTRRSPLQSSATAQQKPQSRPLTAPLQAACKAFVSGIS